MNNTYNMRFTIGYLAYSSSKLSISIPSGIALIAPPYLFLPGQALNVTLQAWNATYCDFLVNFGKTLAPGTNLSMNLTGSNSAPRQMYPDLTFKLSLSNPSTNVLI